MGHLLAEQHQQALLRGGQPPFQRKAAKIEQHRLHRQRDACRQPVDDAGQQQRRHQRRPHRPGHAQEGACGQDRMCPSRHADGGKYAVLFRFFPVLHAGSPPFAAVWLSYSWRYSGTDAISSSWVPTVALPPSRKNHLLHLRKVVQPVGDEEHHFVLCIGLQVGKHLVLGAAVQCREGVVQHQHRARMSQRPGQGQPLGLPAGKAGAAAANDRVGAVFHGKHFVLQGYDREVRQRVLLPAAEHVAAHGVGAEFRVMAQIPDGGRHLPRGQGQKFRLAKPHRTGIGCFTQEHPAQRRFAAGHRAGDADDVAGVGGEVQAGEDGHIAIGKGEIFQGDVSGLRHLQGLQLLRLLHQRLDALPGDFGLLYGVEQLCHLGGFDHQLGKAGQEGGECGNVPAAPPGAQHIFLRRTTG